LGGKLDKNAVHGIVRVQLCHKLQQLFLSGVLREDMLETFHSEFERFSILAANIDFAGWIVTHQHDGEPWNSAGLRLKGGNC